MSRPELLVDGSDAAFRRLVHDLLAFMARHGALRDGMAAFIGLGGAEYTVLISVAHLDEAREGVGLTRVAEHLHLSGAFVTTTTNRLAKLGLITKRTDPSDRRRVLLQVEPEGYGRLDRLAALQSPVNDEEFRPLSGEDFRALATTVERLLASSADALRLQTYLAGQLGQDHDN